MQAWRRCTPVKNTIIEWMMAGGGLQVRARAERVSLGDYFFVTSLRSPGPHLIAQAVVGASPLVVCCPKSGQRG
jgi:hypothetical protein